MKVSKKKILADLGDGADEAPLFITTAYYCGIPAETLVEACAVKDDGGCPLGFRTIEAAFFEDGSEVPPMAGFDEGPFVSRSEIGGWFFPLDAVKPLTALAEDILADAIAREAAEAEALHVAV